MVRALGLHAVPPGPNPILISGSDLFLVVPDSTIPSFVNSQLVTSCQLGFLVNLSFLSLCFKSVRFIIYYFFFDF